MHGTTLAALSVLVPLIYTSRIAQAQGASKSLGGRDLPVIAVPWPAPSLTAADYARLAANIARADSLARADRVVEAEQLYWSVVLEQRNAEEYPGESLRQLAALYFGTGNAFAAADALSELADAASQFGDHLARLHALFDAALLYRDVGRADRVLDCVRQLRLLLKSPAIPDSIRRDMNSRIVVR